VAYMVIFRSVEGKAGYHQAETLGDAVKFVERLRNEEQVDQARIFRMEEVTFEFKPYYRVEVATGEPAAAPDGAPEPEPVPEGAEVAPEPVEANGRRAIFGR
jgi:hypothetical protein